MFKSLPNYFSTGILGSTLSHISKRDKRKLALFTFLQSIIGLLDLVGIGIIGILGSLSIRGINSQPAGNRTLVILKAMKIENFSVQNQVAILGGIALIVLIGKSIFSIFINRKILLTLSEVSAGLSANLIHKILSQNLSDIQSTTSQETFYSANEGVRTLVLEVIGSFISIVAEGFLLFLIVLFLMFIDLTMALALLLTFSFVGVLLYLSVYKRARSLGTQEANLSIESNQLTIEVLRSYREIYLRGRKFFYEQQLFQNRKLAGRTIAELQLMPYLSKYVVEIALLVLLFCMTSLQFLLNDATHAIGLLFVFLASSSRMAPSALRIQQAITTLRGSLGRATPTIELFNKIATNNMNSQIVMEIDSVQDGQDLFFTPEIFVKSINFSYPDTDNLTLKNISCDISAGSFVAIVGPSGSGKSTFIDVILGLHQIETGKVLLSGLPPKSAIECWPGAVGYVPQQTSLENSTILQNIAIGYPLEQVDISRASHCLEVCNLTKLVSSLPDGIHSQIGENGFKLSGGQRQRLGIARALYTNPKILILDESTSSLDGVAEDEISSALLSLKGGITLITIAHRLSTVRNADLVLYMDGGEITARGTFNEVRASVSDFDRQAQLMGL